MSLCERLVTIQQGYAFNVERGKVASLIYPNDKPVVKTDYEQNYCDSVIITLKNSDTPKEFTDVTVRIYTRTPRLEVKTKLGSVYGYNFDSVLSYYMSLKERDFNSVQR